MAKDTSATQTASALKHTASELEDHAASLRAAAALLDGVEPEINQIDVRFENSRKVGLDYLRLWVSAAKKSAYDARVEVAQKRVKINGVRKSKSADTK